MSRWLMVEAMAQTTPFGRKNSPARHQPAEVSRTTEAAKEIPPKIGAKPASPVVPVPVPSRDVTTAVHRLTSGDRILRDEDGPKRSHFPWRQLALMASLCFGLASFVLPDSLNDSFQWPLYGLSAISFFVGIRRRLGA